MRDLRTLIELWGRGNPDVPQAPGIPGNRPSEARDDLYRDRTGKVWVRTRPVGEVVTWPADVPEVDPPRFGGGIPATAWAALGCSVAGVLHWPVGTVAHVMGPRLAGLAVARWLARRLQARPECAPVRYLSARELPADSWHASPGAERTLIVGDVVSGLGRPRLSAVGSLLAGRGRRSVVLLGEFGSGDEWETINTWLRRDGARMVQA